MLALLLVAMSVGLSNFAAAISLGVSGVDARTRLRVGLVFGAFESGMPVVGLLIGSHFAAQLGHVGRWLGGGLLAGVGLYGLISSLRANRREKDEGVTQGVTAPRYPVGRGRLLLSGLALSLDNLVVGFALGTFQVGIVLGAIIIGAVSVALSLAGLEIGARLGAWAGKRGDQLGGVVLMSVGIAMAAGVLS
jgi:putative Mn2+ efflux pump MntP